MQNKNYLLYLMQLAGGTFPSGGFSQSWGLETYVARGQVTDEDSFKEFTVSYLESTVARCEGPIMREAYRLGEDWDEEKIGELEDLSCAVKVTKESRQSALRMGKSMLRIMAEVMDDEDVAALKKLQGPEGITYPVIFGLVCGKLGLGIRDSMDAFVYSTVSALVQSAVKLVPLGNTQAQRVLLDLYPAMEQVSGESLSRPLDEISNFCPCLDIASIRHEHLPVRLYMS